MLNILKEMKKGIKNYLILLVVSLCVYSCNRATEDPDLIDNTPGKGKIVSFSVRDQNRVPHKLEVDNANNIISNKTALPTNVNLHELIAIFETSAKVDNEFVLKVNGVDQVSGVTKNDFFDDVIYDLYASGEKQRSYKVKINKLRFKNNFLTFTFPEKQMQAFLPLIDVETGKITVEDIVPLNVNIKELKPQFTITDPSYSVVKVNGVVQKSGVNSQDFSSPVTYNIESVDGTSKEFTVSMQQGNEAYLTNPIMEGSYADPTVIRVGNEFYLYVTSGRVRGYRSTDLVNWDRIGGTYSEVFATKPNFTGDNINDLGMWAPDINYFDGKYVMYYSMSVWGGGATCGIGVGVSSLPQGPFIPPAGNSNGKLFVSSEIGVHNSIDPCFYEENGKRYLFWGSFYGIYMTELTADGMAVKDMTKKTKIAGKSFEATYIHKRGNYYYLFASVGACCEGMGSSYKVVVGRSLKLEGPYLSKTGVDMKNFDAWNPTNYQPILLRGDAVFGGPGHNSRIITDKNGVDWMLYHSYVSPEINSNTARQLMMDKVDWGTDGWPTIGNGTPSYSMKVAPVF
jgi:arabinan endo-1,5-alpha-L-arabinosidase